MPLPELAAGGRAPRPYLVFTSAGDEAAVSDWLAADRSFDLWVTYYGSAGERYRDVADIYNRRKGGKFQNLLHAYRQWPALFAGYDAIMVLDDDIRISPARIDELFRIRKARDLWILQPAFDRRGKISHAITAWSPRSVLRYVNYIEENVPVFRRDKLEQFLAVYDGEQAGYCIDLFYLWVIGGAEAHRLAIIDTVRCVNPHDHRKTDGKREIEKLRPLGVRIEAWHRVRDRHGITMGFDDFVVLAEERRPPLAGMILLAQGFLIHQYARLERLLRRYIAR